MYVVIFLCWNLSYKQVEIVISNTSIAQRTGVKLHKYSRWTDTILQNVKVSWEDAMELRCCAGWDVQLIVFIIDSQSRQYRYEVDRMIVGNSNSGEYSIRQVYRLYFECHFSLRQNNHVACGCIRVTLDYYPNYQSMATLSVDCFQNAQLPALLLSELHSLLQQPDIAPHPATPLLSQAVQKFHTIQSAKTLETHLFEHHMPHDAVCSPNSTSSCEFSTIATYRLSTIAKSLILSLVHSTTQVHGSCPADIIILRP